jgi:hypothetical protein
MKIINLVGRRFGRLKVQALSATRPHRSTRAYWLCLCDCGKQAIVSSVKLRNGWTKSCGCFRRDKTGKLKRKDGLSGKHKDEYNSYRAMIRRCSDENHQDYRHYGGRGIRVCKRWLHPRRGFRNFLNDLGPRPADTSLDRKNPDRGYKPSNCRWADSHTQAENKRPRTETTIETECGFAL